MAGNGPRRAVSMADIARIAGVSVTTVSHVVNQTRRVAPDTERAVLRAIADRGYVPDNVVRSLRTAGSQTIGLAISLMTDPYLGDLVSSLERAASRSGYSLLLAETHDQDTGELRAVSELLDRRVESILLAPSADPTRALRYAAARQVPVLLVDRASNADVDQVTVENVQSTASLVDHLAEHGHTRIAMITGKPGLSTTNDRITGFRLGMRRHGLRVHAGFLQSGAGDEEDARHAVHHLLGLRTPPTALVVGNNRMTIGAMRGLREAGVRVPEDLALVGFDDFEWADLFHPRLTVIRQPIVDLGEQAVQLLLRRLAEPEAPSSRVVLSPTFVHRDSCGCSLEVRRPA